MGIMRLMDATGDKTTATWDPADEAQVTTAAQLFDAYRAKGLTMFKDQDAGRGEKLDRFDPAVEAIIAVPQLRGG